MFATFFMQSTCPSALWRKRQIQMNQICAISSLSGAFWWIENILLENSYNFLDGDKAAEKTSFFESNDHHHRLQSQSRNWGKQLLKYRSDPSKETLSATVQWHLHIVSRSWWREKRANWSLWCAPASSTGVEEPIEVDDCWKTLLLYQQIPIQCFPIQLHLVEIPRMPLALANNFKLFATQSVYLNLQTG